MVDSSQSKPQPLVIGLTGGIASGKSFVAKLLADLGAAVIDADDIGHEVLLQPLVSRRLVQEFGDEILEPNSNPQVIDRKILGKIVFGDDPISQRRLEKLETIVHPLIHAESIRKLRSIKNRPNPPKAIVVDAPLLLEAKWEPMCDVIIFVDTPRDVRLDRARARGWTDEHFQNREDTQLSMDEKRQAATHVVRAEDAETAKREVQRIWDQI